MRRRRHSSRQSRFFARQRFRVSARGYRQVAQINRLPAVLGRRLIEHFGSLQALFAATTAELQDVDGVGDGRARLIRDGLVRLAEAGYTERLD